MENKVHALQEKVVGTFKFSEQEQKLLKTAICDKVKLERCEYIFDQMVGMKLDKDSTLAFFTYQYYKVMPEEADKLAKSLTKDEQEMVESFKSIKDIQNLTKSEEVDDIKKMFLALSKDVRIVLIKLAGTAYVIAHLELPLSEEEENFIKLVKDIHIPLSERLGQDRLKLAMDDNVVRLEHPKEYKMINDLLESRKEENQKQLETTKARLEEFLADANIKDGEITYRQKHICSIYKKMTTKYPIERIYDILAMRIIVDKVEDCYTLLGRIHAIYRPIPGTVKDYIANPKPNGYQSLHTSVIVENQHPLEIQIRTKEMHKASEFGNASHWLYKEKGSQELKKDALDNRVTWFREAIDNAKDLPAEEFVEMLKADLYGGVIFCQTPRGRVIEFPEGATAIDFAYAIHSDIGNTCVGVKINSKIQPISTLLKNGDIIEILTNPHSKGPSRDWLNLAKTNGARAKIRAFFKNELKEENVKRGKSIMEEAMKAKGITAAQIFTDKYLEEVLNKFSMKEIEEPYAAIGCGSLTANQVLGRFLTLYTRDNPVKTQKTTVSLKRNKDGVLIDGDSGLLVRFAGCCNAIQGDDIIGYVSRGKGVTIHRRNCPNLKFLEPERLLEASWAEKEDSSFIASLHIIADKTATILASVTTQVSNLKMTIVAINAKEVGDTYHIDIAVMVKNKADLDKTIASIKSLKNVQEVYRGER